MAQSRALGGVSYQTIRLGPGRRNRPGQVVCVMEMSSMLAGETFSDHPRTVCPLIASLLRAYNDEIDDRRRSDLYRCAANAVGTRVDHALQERRASEAIHWARVRYELRGWWRRRLRPAAPPPRIDDGPDEIAGYVVRALSPHRLGWLRRRGGWSDKTHRSMLELFDRLITMGSKQGVDELLEELSERLEERRRTERARRARRVRAPSAPRSSAAAGRARMPRYAAPVR
jgi:hypothetical protein